MFEVLVWLEQKPEFRPVNSGFLVNENSQQALHTMPLKSLFDERRTQKHILKNLSPQKRSTWPSINIIQTAMYWNFRRELGSNFSKFQGFLISKERFIKSSNSQSCFAQLARSDQSRWCDGAAGWQHSQCQRQRSLQTVGFRRSEDGKSNGKYPM